MAILHIFADGTTSTDISGHVVKKGDAEAFYDIVNSMNRRLRNEKNKTLRSRIVTNEETEN